MSMNNANDPHAVTATEVPQFQRMRFLPDCFGERWMLNGEMAVFEWMRTLCASYSGAYWKFFRLSNGGFYMAVDQTEPMSLALDSNGFTGEVSADAAGIVATLFALSHLAHKTREGRFVDAFHALLDFADGHPEGRLIFAAID